MHVLWRMTAMAVNPSCHSAQGELAMPRWCGEFETPICVGP
jgi:hypothetical protein